MLEQNHHFFTNDLKKERIMNLTKNVRVGLYDGVQKREKWVKYLMQHLHKEKPTPSEIEASIKWNETNNIEIKQYMKIIEVHYGECQMQSIIKQKQRNQNKAKSMYKNIFYNDWRNKSNTFNNFNTLTTNKSKNHQLSPFYKLIKQIKSTLSKSG